MAEPTVCRPDQPRICRGWLTWPSRYVAAFRRLIEVLSIVLRTAFSDRAQLRRRPRVIGVSPVDADGPQAVRARHASRCARTRACSPSPLDQGQHRAVVMRRKVLLLVGLLLLACFGFGVVLWATWPTASPMEMKFNEIKVGMTLNECERLLGGPSGDYTGEALVVYDVTTKPWPLARQGFYTTHQWYGPTACLSAVVDDESGVIRAVWGGTRADVRGSLLARVPRWIKDNLGI